MRKTNKKGFTLIELLAVIVILAIIIVMAVASVGAVLNRMKKNAYVVEANTIVKALKNEIVTDTSILPTEEDEEDKIIPLSDIELQNGTKSPYGSAYDESSYVKIVKGSTIGVYAYSICIVDAKGNGIPETNIDNVTRNSVTTDVECNQNSTPQYITDEMLVWLDGINNIGTGDANHSSSTTTWYDLSGNSHNFSSVSGAGNFQDKYYVSSNSNCWNLNTTVFNSLSAMTIEVVAQMDNGGDGYSYIVSNRSNGPIYNWMLAVKNNQYMPHGSAQYLDNVYFTYGVPFTAVMQVNNGYLKTYVNNTISQTNTSFTYGSQSSKITVGCYQGGTYLEFFNGRIYAVRIYNRALTETELTINHNIDVTRFGLT